MSDKSLDSAMQNVLSGLSDFRDEEEAKQHKRLWGEISVPLTLHEGLSSYTKTELDAIRKKMEIPNASSLKKAELLSVLEEWIPSLGNQYLLWDSERFGWLTKIAKNDGYLPANKLEPEQVEYFRATGLFYSGTYAGKQILAVPEELIEPITELANDKEVQLTVKRNTEWLKLTRGLLYYYGTLPLTTLIDMLEKHLGETLRLKTYLHVIHEANLYRERDIQIDEEGYSDSRVFSPKRVLQEHESRINVEFYPFTKQQLLTAGVPDFVERNASYSQFVNYLEKNFNIGKEKADQIAEECVYAARIGHGPNDVMQFLTYSVEFDSLETIQSVMDRVVKLMNNTRQWFLKGHTSVELSSVEKNHLQHVRSAGTSQRIEVVKVGRNEPCPCGSGKKYKKCCGRYV
ncbi:Rho termination factor N-terminal domain-containing protein [Bacillus sp. SG-1]|uniref:Rho termination factor N-terminal domain-containing protein n=1 Tax=Bacillus sp. SG-1 TaxID=161544 RepID=UPI0002DFA2D4|nr:Rho termination factor N-terminal domain-containing protein [Bacillus sp. SG-1]